MIAYAISDENKDNFTTYELIGGMLSKSNNFVRFDPYYTPFCGPVWLSQDSRHLFNQCSTVLRIVNNPNKNPTYDGKLSRLKRVFAAADSEVAGRVLAIGQADKPAELGDNKLIIYYSDTLNTDRIVDLPKLLVGETAVSGHGVAICSSTRTASIIMW